MRVRSQFSSFLHLHFPNSGTKLGGLITPILCSSPRLLFLPWSSSNPPLHCVYIGRYIHIHAHTPLRGITCTGCESETLLPGSVGGSARRRQTASRLWFGSALQKMLIYEELRGGNYMSHVSARPVIQKCGMRLVSQSKLGYSVEQYVIERFFQTTRRMFVFSSLAAHIFSVKSP